MKWIRAFVFLCVIAQSSLIAQQDVVLQVEVSRGSSLVATPQLRLDPGRIVGRLELNGEWAASNPLLKGLRERVFAPRPKLNRSARPAA